MGIRKATKKDISAIINLKIETWKSTYKDILAEDYLNEMDANILADRLKVHFDDNRRIVYEEKGEIIGFCVYGDRQEEKEEGFPEYDGEICAIYVKEIKQKEGVGKALFQYAVLDMKNMGKEKFLLWCLTENENARKFYEKMGGTLVGEKELLLKDTIYHEVGYGYEIKRRYGFFGGSFNPPTIAHEKLALEVVKEFYLDKLFFVPMGNSYSKRELVDEKHRYEMLKIVCEMNAKLEVLDIEFGKKLSAIQAFELIQEEYPKEEIYFIMGLDNLEKMPNWERAEELIHNYRYIILQRGNKKIEEVIEENEIFKKYKNNFEVAKNQSKIEYSSSQIRDGIRNNKSIKKKIRKKVMEYIIEEGLYQKEGENEKRI